MEDDYIEEIRVIDIAQEFSILAKANIGKKFTREDAVMAFTLVNRKLTISIDGQNVKWSEAEKTLDQFKAGEWKEI